MAVKKTKAVKAKTKKTSAAGKKSKVKKAAPVKKTAVKTKASKTLKKALVKKPSAGKKKTVKKTSVPKMATAKKIEKNESPQMVEFFDYTLKTLEHYINERAYYIWEEKGFSQDQGETCWKQAESEILHALIRR